MIQKKTFLQTCQPKSAKPNKFCEACYAPPLTFFLIIFVFGKSYVWQSQISNSAFVSIRSAHYKKRERLFQTCQPQTIQPNHRPDHNPRRCAARSAVTGQSVLRYCNYLLECGIQILRQIYAFPREAQNGNLPDPTTRERTSEELLMLFSPSRGT